MALSRAHLVKENKMHFLFASIFLCIFLLEFISGDAGEVKLIQYYVYTRAIFSGRTGRAVPCLSVTSCSRCRKHPPCITQKMLLFFQAFFKCHCCWSTFLRLGSKCCCCLIVQNL